MFITIEGVEGSGKTSHIIPLAQFISSLGLNVITTREPGGTNISEQIRNIIHNLDNSGMHPRVETLLYQAARAQLVEEIIKPNLQKGIIVLCDRYIYSTIAYQGYGHQQNLLDIKKLVDYATNGLEPDFTILLDLDPKLGLERKTKMGEWNRLDNYSLEFHKRVRQGYLEISKMNSSNWKTIDAKRNWAEVHNDLQKTIFDYFAKLRLIQTTSQSHRRYVHVHS